MKKKTIFYIHGLGSTMNSHTVTLLRQLLPEYEVISRDMSFDPGQARIEATYCPSLAKADLVIGTSLGGFYGQFAVCQNLILVNPCLNPKPIIGAKVGKGTYEYFDQRQDGVQLFTIDDKWLNDIDREYNELKKYIRLAGDKHAQKTHIFLGDQDDVIDRELIEPELNEFYKKENIQSIHMGHRMEEDFIKNTLCPFIKGLDI